MSETSTSGALDSAPTPLAPRTMPSDACASVPRVKINYFEWCRALGAIAVVLLHTLIEMQLHAFGSASGVELPLGRALSYAFISTGFTRWAVPVFFMVTGALLLPPQKHMRRWYVWHYAKRMVFVLATFGLLFALVELAVDGVPLGWGLLGQAVLNVLTAKTWDHLWYLYALLGIYVLLPALRALVRHATRKVLRFCIVTLVVVTMLWPDGTAVATGEMPTAGVLVTQYLPAVTYVLTGYYLHQYGRWGVSSVLDGIVAWLVAVVGSVWFTLCGLDGGAFGLPFSPFVWLYSCSLFLGVRHRLDGHPLAEHPALFAIAKYSFGIYVFHVVFLHAAVRVWDFTLLPAGLAELLLFAIALAGGFVSSWVLHRLPVTRRFF